MYGKALVLVVLLLPGFAGAAGFAQESLFLSKSPVIEGDSILIHAVVQNDETTKFDGELVFSAVKGTEAKVKVGSASISMAPGGAQAVSVSWKPLAGEYVVSAALTSKDGKVVEEESARFTINPKPKPASSGDDIQNSSNTQVESSAKVREMISKFSPTVADITAPAFLTIDSLRTKLGELLDQGIAWSKSTKENAAKGDVLGQVASVGATGGEVGFSALKWVVANAGVFYPVAAVGFLFGFWKLLAKIRRPHY